MSEIATTLRVPGDLLAELKPIAEQLSRAGYKAQWSKVALAALRKGAQAMREELNSPDAAA